MNYTYLYEVTSYRDKNGEPRNKQVPIGKIDSQGQALYKPEYIERMMEAGTPLDIRRQTLASKHLHVDGRRVTIAYFPGGI